MNIEAGIYSLFCGENEAMYLGASADIVTTLETLVAELNENKAYDRNLQHDWDYYGAEEFEMSTLEELENPTAEELKALLGKWLIRIPFAVKLEERPE